MNIYSSSALTGYICQRHILCTWEHSFQSSNSNFAVPQSVSCIKWLTHNLQTHSLKQAFHIKHSDRKLSQIDHERHCFKINKIIDKNNAQSSWFDPHVIVLLLVGVWQTFCRGLRKPRDKSVNWKFQWYCRSP